MRGALAEDVTPATKDDIASLRAELAGQEQAIAQLKAAAMQAAKPAIDLRVSGYAQIDWVIHDQASQDEVDFSSGQPINQDRFALRRGHLRFEAQRGAVGGVLEIDANTTTGPQLRPIDAEVSFRWPPAPDHATDRVPPLVLVSLGLMKIPFGFEVPEHDAVRPFLERATVLRALFPGEFDLGASVRGTYHAIDWTLAIMNGSPIGDKVFPALDPVRTKEIVGRIGTRAEIVPGLRFEAGVSGDTGLGFHEGTPSTKAVLVWHDENGDGIVQATEIGVVPGSPATASQEFQRFAVGADARVVLRIEPLGELALRAEIVRGKNLDRGVEYADPVGAGRDLREIGWYLGVTQELTSWGMIGVRYDQYDPDQDSTQQRPSVVVPIDRTYRTLALMAMVRYDNARLLLEYDKNGNALGRDASGAPTTLADDALTLRGQVVF